MDKGMTTMDKAKWLQANMPAPDFRWEDVADEMPESAGLIHRAWKAAQELYGAPVPFKVHVPGCAPTQGYASDAAWDLPVAEEVELWPGKPTKVSTGLSFAIPAEHFGDIRPRSSATLLGIDIAGTVDAAYRGVVYVLATNLTSEPITVRPGQRIGQMIVMPRPRVRMAEVEELPEGERGAAGFGSTGG